ncbi:hypothetical protein F5890DRAFT_1416875 [Lentinula detonsa]|uniref:NAD-binding protein n=1 Tax=Lentinula detonsa TaxID=2804962 RepID=A0AA38PTW7_9AGAR|nr:hypothetical protein F5890DRAFT_1416875 [Lentinula detonsa]
MAAKSLGVALVTGAAQGIGRTIALRLAKDGFMVAVNDISSKTEQLETLSQDIELLNAQMSLPVVADVSNEVEVEKMVTEVSKTLGGLNVMVANAGIIIPERSARDTTEDWDKIFAVNMRGVFLSYKYAARQMIAQGNGGRILGASSIAGRKAGFEASAYCASKFAVRGLTQSAGNSRIGKYGITVNAYAPGK